MIVPDHMRGHAARTSGMRWLIAGAFVCGPGDIHDYKKARDFEVFLGFVEACCGTHHLAPEAEDAVVALGIEQAAWGQTRLDSQIKCNTSVDG